MQVAMTPHVTTPVVFQQSLPPWVLQTPEQSPMLWGRAPVNDRYVSQPEVSKEFLRSVCEPFFDQMLMAVQQALCVQGQQTSQMQGPCWQQMPSSQQGSVRPSDEPSTEEGSDIVSDSGAFSSILTPHAGFIPEEEGMKFVADAPTKDESDNFEVECSEGAEVQSHKFSGEPLPAPAMVCRHWKSKGWCRMEHNCKFLHPEHKRGVSVSNAKPGGLNNDGAADNCDSIVLSSISSDQPALTLMAMDGKPKAAKKRKSKGKSGTLKQEAAVPGQPLSLQSDGNV